jgi:hypothetical protein
MDLDPLLLPEYSLGLKMPSNVIVDAAATAEKAKKQAVSNSDLKILILNKTLMD